MKNMSFVEDGITYHELYVADPFVFGIGKNTSAGYVEHIENKCGGHIYIGDNAILRCVKCNSSAHVSKCKFTNNPNGFSISFTGGDSIIILAEMMILAGQLVQVAGLSWLQKFMNNLEQ